MPSNARDLQNTIITMLLNQKMQERSERAAAEQRQQQAMFDQQMEREKEDRQFRRELVKSAFQKNLERAAAGENFSSDGVAPDVSAQLKAIQTASRQDAAIQSLTDASISGNQGGLEAAQAGLVAAGGPAPTDPLFGVVNREVNRRRGVQIPAQLAQLEQKRKEEEVTTGTNQTRAFLDSYQDQVAYGLVGKRLGLQGFAEASPFESVAENPTLLGIPREQLEKARAAGQRKATKLLAEHYQRMMSAEGPTQEQSKRAAYAKLRAMSRRDGRPFGSPDHIASLGDEDFGSLMSSGNLTQDPLQADQFAFFSDVKAGSRWQDGRNAIGDMLLALENTEVAFSDAQILGDSLKIGPLVGTEAAQALFRLVGQQDPRAAAYETWRFTLVSKLLKATQGSRPSDFDLYRYLSLLPGIDEIGTPAGQAKMDAFKEQLLISARAPFDPEIQKQIELAKKNRTDAEKRAEASARAYVRAIESGDAERIKQAEADMNRITKANRFGQSEEDTDFSEAERRLQGGQ